MAEDFARIAPKAAHLIRMLIAPAEGEVLNAVRALLRLLASAGFDIHTLSEQVERPAPALTKEHMEKIFDAGFEKGFSAGDEHGRRSAVPAATAMSGHDVASGPGVNGYSWRQIAQSLFRKHSSVHRSRCRVHRDHRQPA
jgi:hypothetical protein